MEWRRCHASRPGGTGCGPRLEHLLPVSLLVFRSRGLELHRILLHLLHLVCDCLDGSCLLVSRVDDNGGLQVEGPGVGGLGLLLVVHLLWRICLCAASGGGVWSVWWATFSPCPCLDGHLGFSSGKGGKTVIVGAWSAW